MKHAQSLPEPTTDALEHSINLIAKIRDDIEANGDSISFKRYMEMALYEPVEGITLLGHTKLYRHFFSYNYLFALPFFSTS